MFDNLMQVLGFTAKQTPPSAVAQPEPVAAPVDDEYDPMGIFADRERARCDRTVSRIGRKVPTPETQALSLWCLYRTRGDFNGMLSTLGSMRPALQVLVTNAGSGYLDRLCKMSTVLRRRGLMDYLDGWVDENGCGWNLGDRFEPWERLGLLTAEQAKALDNAPNKLWGPNLRG